MHILRRSKQGGTYMEAYAKMYAPHIPWYAHSKFKKLYMAVTGSLLGAAILMTSMAGASNLSIGGPSDCDDNAIIRCGAHSVDALVSDYNSKPYIRGVYAAFGINNGDISALSSNAVQGRVTKQGDVYANGRLVAQNAMTGGRQDIPGSTKMNFNGAIFFARPPSVSFQSDSLPAFVSMNNGQFQFAVIASCGNPVKAAAVPAPQPKPSVAPAKPVTKPKHHKPQPQPQPPAPTPPPTPAAPTQTQQQQQTQTQQVTQNVNQVQQVTVENKNEVKLPQPRPAPKAATSTVAAAPVTEQPAQTVATVPASTTLPNTGPGDVIGIFSVVNLLGYLGYRQILLRKFA